MRCHIGWWTASSHTFVASPMRTNGCLFSGTKPFLSSFNGKQRKLPARPSLFFFFSPPNSAPLLTFLFPLLVAHQVQGGDDTTTKGRDKEVGTSTATLFDISRNPQRIAALQIARGCRHARRNQTTIQSLRICCKVV